jgi:hypothetical protein
VLEIGELEEPAAPESSRTAQNQVNIAASSSSQTSTVQMVITFLFCIIL